MYISEHKEGVKPDENPSPGKILADISVDRAGRNLSCCQFTQV
jgi:hypothetical protein